ncbi:MAG: hypothetical protein ACLRFE_01740 [Clostridia bacterium]
MEKNNEQLKVAESQDNKVAQTENKIEQKPSVKNNKTPLTPYQKYKNSRNQNGKKYFDFYDDIKVYIHNIYDW